MNASNPKNIIPLPFVNNNVLGQSTSSIFIDFQDLKQPLADNNYSPLYGLLVIAIDAVTLVEWPNKHKPFGLDKSFRIDSTLLMVLEVYCYAQGIYESAMVEEFLKTDHFFSIVFKTNSPSSLLIKRFRREHRSYIKACLLNLFDVVFRARFGNPDSEETPVDFCVTKAIDTWFEPICGPRPSREAEERIDQAIFWDGMAMAS